MSEKGFTQYLSERKLAKEAFNKKIAQQWAKWNLGAATIVVLLLAWLAGEIQHLSKTWQLGLSYQLSPILSDHLGKGLVFVLVVLLYVCLYKMNHLTKLRFK